MSAFDRLKVGLWVVGGIILATVLGVAVWYALAPSSFSPKVRAAPDAGHR